MEQLLSHQEQLLGAATGRFALLEAHHSPASQPAPGAPARRGDLPPLQLPNFLALPSSGHATTPHLLLLSYVMAIAMETD